MNTTTNYNLPQWEATDRITRSSVNSAMSTIDSGIRSAANAAANAQSTANSAAAAAAAGAGKWQLIKTVTLSQTGASFIADVSDIDFSQWHAIRLAHCSGSQGAERSWTASCPSWMRLLKRKPHSIS